MYTFYEFANLGDLRQYTLSQIKSAVKKMQFIEYSENGYLYIDFSAKYTKISIEYNLDESFNKIVYQEHEHEGSILRYNR